MKSSLEALDAFYRNNFQIQQSVMDFCSQTEKELAQVFEEIDRIAQYNQLKVLKAMQENKLADSHFSVSTGYGYNDAGRDILEKIYADIFGTESALVRPQLISGTHAITVALSGNLRAGDELFSPVGPPYDTLQGVIGIRPTRGSLMEQGISYGETPLTEEGCIDYEAIGKAISNKTKIAMIQRSKGYAWRRSFPIHEIKKLIAFIKNINPNIICLVDNCYGEFADIWEPSEAGADLTVGSLIKNPGGGIAPVGGYIAGKEVYVENAAFRLTAPGLGKEVGPGLGITPKLLQGLFFAPQVVSGSMKGAVFASRIFERLGFAVLPTWNEERADIVQAIRFGTKDKLISFCSSIQRAAPVDSFVTPLPWDMPGYDCQVIMAAGAFVQGSSIELSADGPVKEPYIAYFQGGLTWHHARLGVILAANALI